MDQWNKRSVRGFVNDQRKERVWQNALCKGFYDYFNTIAPFDRQESWDNSGLLVGDPKQRVDTLAVALDMTPEAVQMAREAGAQLFISHHPVIFHAQKQFLAQEPAYLLAQAGMSAVCAHTSLDVAQGGVMMC